MSYLCILLSLDLTQGLYKCASWLEEINRRQSGLLAAQATIDRLQERELVLCTENESIKVCCLHFQEFKKFAPLMRKDRDVWEFSTILCCMLQDSCSIVKTT